MEPKYQRDALIGGRRVFSTTVTSNDGRTYLVVNYPTTKEDVDYLRAQGVSEQYLGDTQVAIGIYLKKAEGGYYFSPWDGESGKILSNDTRPIPGQSYGSDTNSQLIRKLVEDLQGSNRNALSQGIPLSELPPGFPTSSNPSPTTASPPSEIRPEPAPLPPGGSGSAGNAPPPNSTPVATNPPTGGSTPIKPTQPATPVTVASTGYLSYPLKMKKEQDKIKFQAASLGNRESKAPDRGAGQDALDFNFGERTFDLITPYVLLPIQSSITDQNSVDWGPDSINAIDSSMYYKSLELMQQPTSDVAGSVGGYANQIAKAFKKRSDLTKRYLAGQAAGNSNILARTDGVMLNPNMELLFTGPQLRPFSFQIKLSARDVEEAKVIKQIIKYFKQNMAVKKGQDKLFLQSPNVFKISYLKWDKEQNKYINHPGLNLIHSYGSDEEKTSTKACALTNCSVDYTPLGSYATYNDGTMVAYNISLQFQDIYPIYNEDYTGKDSPGLNHAIGY